jgi:hypothetical protein
VAGIAEMGTPIKAGRRAPGGSQEIQVGRLIWCPVG